MFAAWQHNACRLRPQAAEPSDIRHFSWGFNNDWGKVGMKIGGNNIQKEYLDLNFGEDNHKQTLTQHINVSLI